MSLTMNFEQGTIKEKLATLPEKMLDYAFEVLMRQAELIRDTAKVYCPVDTGSLRDSIRVERGGESLHWRQVSVRAGGYITNPKTGKIVAYATYMERKYAYMKLAYALVKPTINEMIKANVVQKINE